MQAGAGLGRLTVSRASSARAAQVRMATATSAADSGAKVGMRSASWSAKSSTAAGATLATMARSWPADRVPSSAAAEVTARLRSRLAVRTTRAASPPTMRAWSRSQAVMEVAASASQRSATSNSP